MSRRFEVSSAAARDLDEIAAYIARDDSLAARRWLATLRARARKAARDPYLGRMVPEYQREDIREVVIGNYRLGYRVGSTEVTLLFVLEGHRRLGAIDG